jgi:hypothetical protein
MSDVSFILFPVDFYSSYALRLSLDSLSLRTTIHLALVSEKLPEVGICNVIASFGDNLGISTETKSNCAFALGDQKHRSC